MAARPALFVFALLALGGAAPAGSRRPCGRSIHDHCSGLGGLESIRQWERHLARNGTVIVKFWLNVSMEEQKNRFLRRLDRADKHWKFSAKDLDDRARWPEYMHAYQEGLRQQWT